MEGENKIIECVLKSLNDIDEGKLICELFLGCGSITIFVLSNKFKIQAFDINELSIKAINKSSKKIGLNTYVFPKIRNLKKNPLTSNELKIFGAIIINPTRSGASFKFTNISKSIVPIVISISCNINTFVRDAKKLINNYYRLKFIQPIDKFLFSSHIEMVTLFKLNEFN